MSSLLFGHAKTIQNHVPLVCPFWATVGFCRSAAQTIPTPFPSRGCWTLRVSMNSSCPHAWRWSADCGSCWKDSPERMDCSLGMALPDAWLVGLAAIPTVRPGSVRRNQFQLLAALNLEELQEHVELLRMPVSRWVKWPCPMFAPMRASVAKPARVAFFFWFGALFGLCDVFFSLASLLSISFDEACVHIPWIETATRPLNSVWLITALFRQFVARAFPKAVEMCLFLRLINIVTLRAFLNHQHYWTQPSPLALVAAILVIPSSMLKLNSN